MRNSGDMALNIFSASVELACTWKLVEDGAHGSNEFFRVVDVYVHLKKRGSGHKDENSEWLSIDQEEDDDFLSHAKTTLKSLLSGLSDLVHDDTTELALKLILPYRSGYVVRSDFLRQRMVGYDLAVSCLVFTDAKRLVKAPDWTRSQPQSFLDILNHSIGAVVLHETSVEDSRRFMENLNRELVARLSYSWIVTSPLSSNRLVIVGSRHQLVMADWFESAYTLGVQITLVGAEDHFLHQQWSLYPAIEQYLAIDMTIDEDLASRITEVLAKDGSSFGGITTFKDPYLIPVAKVAERLDLPVAPLEAVNICLDKHLTRRVVQNTSEGLRVASLTELKRHLDITSLKYPLIVKPCTGYGSEGVFRVTNELELTNAVAKLDDGPEKTDILIDAYIDGPEIDANFVLYDSEILFYELVDGLPCTAENEDSKGGNFLETDQMWPSNHSARESDMLRRELHAALLQLGFRNGVFHVEARIQNSDMHYTVENGLQDLRPDHQRQSTAPTWSLMEINQRPPGHGGFSSTKWVYGIDYMALYTLCVMGEKERVKALSQPFAFPGGAQGWCDSVFINAESAGIYDGEDIRKQIKEQRPDLIEGVYFSACYYKHGETVLDDPPRIALFVMTSKVSRLDVRQKAHRLREFAQGFVKVR